MKMEDTLAVIKVGGPQTSKAGPQDDQKGQKRERKDHSSNNDMGKWKMTRLKKW